MEGKSQVIIYVHRKKEREDGGGVLTLKNIKKRKKKKERKKDNGGKGFLLKRCKSTSATISFVISLPPPFFSFFTGRGNCVHEKKNGFFFPLVSRVFFSIRLTIVSCCSFCFFYFNSKLFRIRGFKISSVDYVISIYGDSDFEGEKKNKCLVFNSLLLSLPLSTGPKVLYPIAFQKK